MQTVRPNFSCTVCHCSFEDLHDFKKHLESQEHELAYGIRLRNSMIGSYFCNCCHICVNTLLIWKSHIMGVKHMKIACAFSLAYSNFDFDKPAKVADIGVLDQNVEVPESLKRPVGKINTVVKSLEPSAVIIGVTDILYSGPGLYHCCLCDDPFNEGNKSQHLLSTRHRVNVFKRWDQALADEALMCKEVGKPEFSTRCQSIAEDIFPVEQNVLSEYQKKLYARIMGHNAILDEEYHSERMEADAEYKRATRSTTPPREKSRYVRELSGNPDPQQRVWDPFSKDRPRGRPRDNHYAERRGGRSDNFRSSSAPDHPNRSRSQYRDEPRYSRDDGVYGETSGYHQPPDRGPRRNSRSKPRIVTIDSDIKCDLALECVRMLMQNLNVFVAETQSTAITRVEVLKSQILFEEVLKMAHPKKTMKATADDDFITVFHNGRLTLKRKEVVSKKPEVPATVVKTEEKQAPALPPLPEPVLPKRPVSQPPPISQPPPTSQPPPIIPPPILDPWGRPMMIPPGYPPMMPGYPPLPHGPSDPARPVPAPLHVPEEEVRHGSPRKRTPPPPGLESQKRARSRSPERVVTVKSRLGSRHPPDLTITGKPTRPQERPHSRHSPTRKLSPTRGSPPLRRRSSPRKSPPRRSSPDTRRSPRRSPPRNRSSKRSPSGRYSPQRRRRSPHRREPRARSPRRENRTAPPISNPENGDGTLFLDEGDYAELLNSLG